MLVVKFCPLVIYDIFQNSLKYDNKARVGGQDCCKSSKGSDVAQNKKGQELRPRLRRLVMFYVLFLSISDFFSCNCVIQVVPMSMLFSLF